MLSMIDRSSLQRRHGLVVIPNLAQKSQHSLNAVSSDSFSYINRKIQFGANNNLDTSQLLRRPAITVNDGRSLEQAQETVLTKIDLEGDKPVRNVGDTPVYDMRKMPLADIRRFLDTLLGTGKIVLHGGYSEAPYALIDPGKSKNPRKKSVIYATEHVLAALKSAIWVKEDPEVLRIRQQKDVGENFHVRMHVNGKRPFGVFSGVAALLRDALQEGPQGETYQKIFTDGYVYILPSKHFTQDDPTWVDPHTQDRTKGENGERTDTDHEWNSGKITQPLAVIKISRDLAPELFVLDGPQATVKTYSDKKLLARYEEALPFWCNKVQRLEERVKAEQGNNYQEPTAYTEFLKGTDEVDITTLPKRERLEEYRLRVWLLRQAYSAFETILN